jgi:hypothetical protein
LRAVADLSSELARSTDEIHGAVSYNESSIEEIAEMNSIAKRQLKQEVETLATEAFHRHLISGYGDGEDADEYQIVIEGKPRHYPLELAHALLLNLLKTVSGPVIPTQLL